MTMNRRSFLAWSLTAAAALMTSHRPLSAAEPSIAKSPRLRFASRLYFVRGDLSQQLAWIEKQGFESIELNGNPVQMHAAWKQAFAHSSLIPSALNWNSLETIVAGTAQQRSASIDSLKAAIDTCGDLKIPNIVIVPPRLRPEFTLPEPTQSFSIIRDVLGSLADRASQAGTCLMIEPVTPKDAQCINTVADAVNLCTSINKPGVAFVFDFCKMIQTEPDLAGAIERGAPFLRQVHLSSSKRTFPGQEKEDVVKFRDGFRGLKKIGYNGFCCFECGNKENYQDKVGASMEFLRTQWDAA